MPDFGAETWAAIGSFLAATAAAIAAFLTWQQQRNRNRWDAHRDIRLTIEQESRYSEWKLVDGGQEQTTRTVGVITLTNTGQRTLSVMQVSIDFADAGIGGFVLPESRSPVPLDVGKSTSVEVGLADVAGYLNRMKGEDQHPRLQALRAVTTEGLVFTSPLLEYWAEFPKGFTLDKTDRIGS